MDDLDRDRNRNRFGVGWWRRLYGYLNLWHSGFDSPRTTGLWACNGLSTKELSESRSRRFGFFRIQRIPENKLYLGFVTSEAQNFCLFRSDKQVYDLYRNRLSFAIFLDVLPG